MSSKLTCQRLLKKLSALRATLSDEEQELLDSLLLNEERLGDGSDMSSLDEADQNSWEKPTRKRKVKRYSFKFDPQREAYILQ